MSSRRGQPSLAKRLAAKGAKHPQAAAAYRLRKKAQNPRMAKQVNERY